MTTPDCFCPACGKPGAWEPYCPDCQDALDAAQFCAYCSEQFPADDPMVSYDGNDYCSPDCVREMLNNEDPCDHATYVGAVGRFNSMLGRIMAKEDPEA